MESSQFKEFIQNPSNISRLASNFFKVESSGNQINSLIDLESSLLTENIASLAGR